MLARPHNNASQLQILDFTRAWMKLAATHGFESAVAELDSHPSVAWSQSLFAELTFDYFNDGRQPEITNPDLIAELRINAIRYDNGSGYAVDYDLPLDGKRSDFTVQLEFRKGRVTYSVYLADIHVL